MPEIDESLFPIVVVRWRETLTEEHVGPFLARIEAMALRAEAAGGLLVSVHDARGLSSKMDPATRKALSDGIQSRPMPTLIDVVVSESALVRGVMTALAWFAPQQMRRVVAVPTLPKAADAIEKEAAARGVRCPDVQRLRLRVA
jgi:hypothetical protein